MKKPYRAFLPIALLFLSACWSFGAYELPEQEHHLEIQHCKSEPVPDGLEWKLTYLGPSKALSTAKTAWNTHLRYVYPFTRHTQLFEISLKNQSESTLWLEPDQVQLIFADRVQAPLDLAFFEQAWPSGAVRSETELLDRSLAVSEIYKRMLMTRPVLPGESVTGVLVFRTFEGIPSELKIENWRWGQQLLTQAFCLESVSK